MIRPEFLSRIWQCLRPRPRCCLVGFHLIRFPEVWPSVLLGRVALHWLASCSELMRFHAWLWERHVPSPFPGAAMGLLVLVDYPWIAYHPAGCHRTIPIPGRLSLDANHLPDSDRLFLNAHQFAGAGSLSPCCPPPRCHKPLAWALSASGPACHVPLPHSHPHMSSSTRCHKPLAWGLTGCRQTCRASPSCLPQSLPAAARAALSPRHAGPQRAQ